MISLERLICFLEVSNQPLALAYFAEANSRLTRATLKASFQIQAFGLVLTQVKSFRPQKQRLLFPGYIYFP